MSAYHFPGVCCSKIDGCPLFSGDLLLSWTKSELTLALPDCETKISLSFDTEFPAECDDEFWETNDPATAFKQPKGKPSQMSYLIAQIRLTEILAFTLRTLYSTKKSKMLTGMIGKDWEYQIVAELDSAMNKWKDSLPYYRELSLDPYTSLPAE